MMKPNAKEVQRRTKAALRAIKQAMKNDSDEDSGVKLFVAHHLQELDDAYWKKHAGTVNPKPADVLPLLELCSHWGEDEEGDIDDDGIDTFDFTLPGDVTQYVISVTFDEDGEVEDIAMES
jgi:hypothetical protein